MCGLIVLLAMAVIKCVFVGGFCVWAALLWPQINPGADVPLC